MDFCKIFVKYSEVPNKFYSILGFFPTYMALLGPTYTYLFLGKVPTYAVFYVQ